MERLLLAQPRVIAGGRVGDGSVPGRRAAGAGSERLGADDRRGDGQARLAGRDRLLERSVGAGHQQRHLPRPARAAGQSAIGRRLDLARLLPARRYGMDCAGGRVPRKALPENGGAPARAAGASSLWPLKRPLRRALLLQPQRDWLLHGQPRAEQRPDQPLVRLVGCALGCRCAALF